MPAEALSTVSAHAIMMLKNTAQGLKQSRYTINVSCSNTSMIIIVGFIMAFHTFQMSLQG